MDGYESLTVLDGDHQERNRSATRARACVPSLIKFSPFIFTFLTLQERCIRSGTLTVNYEKVDIDYRLKHNDLLANIVHRYPSY